MTTDLPDMISKELKILVIDDVPSARKVLGRMLNMIGLSNLTEVSSVQEAVETLKSGQAFGLVISDIHLKDGKGTDILETVNALEEKLPTIFVTSDMEKSTFLAAMDKGASTYLLKPFSPPQLVTKIKEAFKVP